MNCIFCKLSSDSSCSVEHIIPESLGNKDHVLPQGWVCDACNNYLSREVEAPFLNSNYGKRSRFEMQIPSKKNKFPIVSGLHPRSRTKVNFLHDEDGLSFFAAEGEDEAHFVNTVLSQPPGSTGSLWIPTSGEPDSSYETSRFIGKIGLEVLAHRGVEIDGWNQEFVAKQELDELRNYVRRGRPGFIWPVHMRRLYPADRTFSDESDPCYQVHEFNILFIPTEGSPQRGEFYAVVAILGMEYSINLGGPEIDGYLAWLERNNHRSHLY